MVKTRQSRKKLKSKKDIPKIDIKTITKYEVLRKDLWMNIFDFLDSRTFFCSISLVNKYFYSISCDFHKFRTTMSLQVTIYTLPNTTNVEISKKPLVLVGNAFNLEKLRLKVKVKQSGNNSLLQTTPKTLTSLFIFIRTLKTIKILSENYLIISSILPHLAETTKISCKVDKITESEVAEFFNSLSTNIKVQSLAFKIDEACFSAPVFYQFPLVSIASSLKTLKISPAFRFSPAESEKFSNTLSKNTTLNTVHISETITLNLDPFINMLKNNKTIKTLCLGHLTNERSFVLLYQNAIMIFHALSTSNIEDFSVFVDSQHEIWRDFGLANRYDGFDLAIDNMLEKSQLKRFSLGGLTGVDQEKLFALREIVIKNVRSAKLKRFCGVNIRKLLKNRVKVISTDVAPLKNHAFSQSLHFSLLCEVLKVIVPEATNLKLLKNDTKTYDLDDILSKNIFYIPENNSNILKYLVLFSLPRMPYIQYLDLTNFNDFSTSELEKYVIKSLKKLDGIAFQAKYHRIVFCLEELLKYHPGIERITCASFSNYHCSLVFEKLTEFKMLKILKLEDVRVDRYYKENVLSDFVDGLRLKELCISKVSFYNSDLQSLLLSIKKNQELERLLLNHLIIIYEDNSQNDKNEEKNRAMEQKDLENIISVLSSVSNKTRLKILSCNISGMHKCSKGVQIDGYFYKYLSLTVTIIENNPFLEEFSVFFPIYGDSLVEYSKFMREALKKNNLTIINGFDFRKFISEPHCPLGDLYGILCANGKSERNEMLRELRYRQPQFTWKQYYMNSLILSEVVKTKKPLLIQNIFKNYIENSILNLDGIFDGLSDNYLKIFICNCVSAIPDLKGIRFGREFLDFKQLKILNYAVKGMGNLNSVEVITNACLKVVYSLNIKIEKLRLESVIFKDCDWFYFINGIGRLQIKELILDSISIEQLDHSFLEIIRPIPFLEILDITKIPIRQATEIIKNLVNLPYLKSLGLELEEHFPESKLHIKALISFVSDPHNNLKSFRVHKYWWRYFPLQKVKDKFFLKKVELATADLFVMKNLLKLGLLKSIYYLNMTGNNIFTDMNVKYLRKIIEMLDLKFLVIKFTDFIGFEKEKIKELFEELELKNLKVRNR